MSPILIYLLLTVLNYLFRRVISPFKAVCLSPPLLRCYFWRKFGSWSHGRYPKWGTSVYQDLNEYKSPGWNFCWNLLWALLYMGFEASLSGFCFWRPYLSIGVFNDSEFWGLRSALNFYHLFLPPPQSPLIHHRSQLQSYCLVNLDHCLVITRYRPLTASFTSLSIFYRFSSFTPRMARGRPRKHRTKAEASIAKDLSTQR